MKKIIISAIALAAISGGAFASNDASNGYAGRNIADTLNMSAPATDFQNSASVLVTPGSTQIGDREAGSASH